MGFLESFLLEATRFIYFLFFSQISKTFPLQVTQWWYEAEAISLPFLSLYKRSQLKDKQIKHVQSRHLVRNEAGELYTKYFLKNPASYSQTNKTPSPIGVSENLLAPSSTCITCVMLRIWGSWPSSKTKTACLPKEEEATKYFEVRWE